MNFSRIPFLLRTAILLVLGASVGTGNVTAQTRPMGTDVSHYQGAGINWTTVKNDGVSFAWTKATEATYYIDADFVTNEVKARAAGVMMGAYHFARPSANPNLTGASSADSEAAYFWATAGDYIVGGGGYCVPMLDWEDTGVTNVPSLTTSVMSQWVNQWCNDVSNYARARGLIIKPVVYTGTWYSRPGAYPGLNTTVTNWPSWIASYPSCTTSGGVTRCGSATPQTSVPPSSFPWSTWNIWQYGDTNWSGGDADVFNGTTNQFISLFVIKGTNAPLGGAMYWDPGFAKSGSGSGGSGTWNDTNKNWWYNGTSNLVWSPDPDTAVFAGDSRTPGGTVTLAHDENANGLTFSQAGYTIAGTTHKINLSSPGAISVGLGEIATVQCILAGIGFKLSGGGVLSLNNTGNLSGGQTVTGPTTTLAVATDHNTGANGVPLTLSQFGIYQDNDTVANDQMLLQGCTLVLGTDGGILKNPNANLSLTNLVSGVGSLTLAGGSFTLTLSNAANTYYGGTVVQSGALKAAVAGALGSTTGRLVASGGALNLNGVNHTVGVVTISGGTISNGTLTGSSYAGQSGLVSAVLAGTGAMIKTTTGKLTLTGVNTYKGSTLINTGILALGGNASISNSPGISIGAGGNFDVSALTNYFWSSNTALTAGGTATPATITGSNVINMGSQPMTFTYDGVHPALTVAQGFLVLNGNNITVNGPQLAGGRSYVLIQQLTANIGSAGEYPVNGTAIGAPHTSAAISISSNQMVLTVTDDTTVAVTVPGKSFYGDSVTFTATVAPAPTGGTVQIYDNGAALSEPLSPVNGVVSFTTSTLSVGIHSIAAAYNGWLGFAPSITASAAVQSVAARPSIPAVIKGIAMLPNSTMQVDFSGAPDSVYLVKASDCLTPPTLWTTLSTNIADANGNFYFVDTDATNHPGRFYRTMAQ